MMKAFKGWSNCCVAGLLSSFVWLSPNAQAQKLELALLASDLTAPIHLEELPDGSGRFVVVQQDGLVKLMAADGKVQPEPVMDLRSRMLPVANDFEERGLLGFALHPQFAKKRAFLRQLFIAIARHRTAKLELHPSYF